MFPDVSRGVKNDRFSRSTAESSQICAGRFRNSTRIATLRYSPNAPPTMTPEAFIALWKDNPLTERAGAQAWFDDLCDLLGVEKPRDPENYCFERGARKSGGGDGWADVWMRARFGWENKRPGRDLAAALKQLTDYFLNLESPPLLVVADRERIIIHTAFTGYPDEPREIRIEQLVDPEQRQILKWVFTDPEKLRPEKSTAAITAEAAGHFAQLAAAMRGRGEEGQNVAHFLVQCLFCMFAEDEQLLPAGLFTGLLAKAANDPARAANRLKALFSSMQTGGDYGDHLLAWFNGGLFSARDTAPDAARSGGIKLIEIPRLTVADLQALHSAASDMDWRAIDPTIFGTLFERGLDPTARAPLGAHYTDTGTITKLTDPLISEPLLAEWARTKAEILAKPKKAKAAYQTFLLRLNRFRVLDPACGSGNFLYLALKAPARRREARPRRSAGTRPRRRTHHADRPAQHPRPRNQRIRRRTRPRHRLDRRHPVVPPQRLPARHQPDSQAARRHRTPRRPAQPGRQRSRMADRRRHRRQPAFPRWLGHARRTRR